MFYTSRAFYEGSYSYQIDGKRYVACVDVPESRVRAILESRPPYLNPVMSLTLWREREVDAAKALVGTVWCWWDFPEPEIVAAINNDLQLDVPLVAARRRDNHVVERREPQETP